MSQFANEAEYREPHDIQITALEAALEAAEACVTRARHEYTARLCEDDAELSDCREYLVRLRAAKAAARAAWNEWREADRVAIANQLLHAVARAVAREAAEEAAVREEAAREEAAREVAREVAREAAEEAAVRIAWNKHIARRAAQREAWNEPPSPERDARINQLFTLEVASGEASEEDFHEYQISLAVQAGYYESEYREYQYSFSIEAGFDEAEYLVRLREAEFDEAAYREYLARDAADEAVWRERLAREEEDDEDDDEVYIEVSHEILNASLASVHCPAFGA